MQNSGKAQNAVKIQQTNKQKHFFPEADNNIWIYFPLIFIHIFIEEIELLSSHCSPSLLLSICLILLNSSYNPQGNHYLSTLKKKTLSQKYMASVPGSTFQNKT